jgi:hypothetical protein
MTSERARTTSNLQVSALPVLVFVLVLVLVFVLVFVPRIRGARLLLESRRRTATRTRTGRKLSVCDAGPRLTITTIVTHRAAAV